MAAWISALSLATLAIVAAITAVLGWRRSTLFREGFASLAIEFGQEQVWADESWTLLVLTAKLRNTSQVLVQIERMRWRLWSMVPGTLDPMEMANSPDGWPSDGDIYLEPQEEDIFVSEVWLPTQDLPQPAFAELMVHCARDQQGNLRGWTRRIHFTLENSDA